MELKRDSEAAPQSAIEDEIPSALPCLLASGSFPGRSSFLFRFVLHYICHQHTASLQRLAIDQLQINLAIHLIKKRNARAEQHRMNVEADLINQVCLEERLRQQPATMMQMSLPSCCFSRPTTSATSSEVISSFLVVRGFSVREKT